ncbi:MAG: XisI protein [Chloroflexota bacterium]
MGLENYRDIIKGFLSECMESLSSTENIRIECVTDDEQKHYEIMEIGWEGDRRIHDSFIHIDIIEDKVWLQHNATEERVAEELIKAGIPRQAIVLGFQPPRVRQFTECAVA